ALQALEHAHHAQAAVGIRARGRARANALDEVLALEPQRLVVGDAGREGVARAGDVLAPRAGVLVEALVVDRQLALAEPGVERRHPPRADDRDAALLVRVKPGQMQVRDDTRGKAQVTEDDVLDARADVGAALREALLGLFADQVQRDG